MENVCIKNEVANVTRVLEELLQSHNTFNIFPIYGKEYKDVEISRTLWGFNIMQHYMLKDKIKSTILLQVNPDYVKSIDTDYTLTTINFDNGTKVTLQENLSLWESIESFNDIKCESLMVCTKDFHKAFTDFNVSFNNNTIVIKGKSTLWDNYEELIENEKDVTIIDTNFLKSWDYTYDGEGQANLRIETESNYINMEVI